MALALTLVLTAVVHVRAAEQAVRQAAPPKMGEVLPIPEPKQDPITEPDWRKVPMPKRFQVRPPQGAPNVVIVLMDQAGYADPSTMGGGINTPTMDKLAAGGLLYTNFHVNALCSPSRTALLTGRNNHQNRMAGVTGTNTSYPGDTGIRPPSISTIGLMLQSWGYTTGYFGKNNEVPDNEVNISGPFDRWPTRSGFDKFYGYLAGEQSNFFPGVYDGTTYIGIPREKDYHFATDLTNKAVAWIQATRSLTPDRPFFLYFARARAIPRTRRPRAGSRRTCTKASSTRAGTSTARKSSRDRSSWASFLPAPSSPRILHACRSGTSLSADEKKLFARQMEVYATLTEHADYEVGRLVEGIEETGRDGEHVVHLHLRRQRWLGRGRP